MKLSIARKLATARILKSAQTKRVELKLNFNILPLEKVETKGKENIEDVCEYLKKPEEQSLKSLVYKVIKGNEESFIIYYYFMVMINLMKLNYKTLQKLIISYRQRIRNYSNSI